jgi:hypothetical protein
MDDERDRNGRDQPDSRQQQLMPVLLKKLDHFSTGIEMQSKSRSLPPRFD